MPTSINATTSDTRPLRIGLLALPESSASVLYGLYDVLRSVGDLWSELTGDPPAKNGFEVSILSPSKEGFHCWGGVPVSPHTNLGEAGTCDIVIVSDLAISVELDPRGRWPEITEWLCTQQKDGALICAVCTGSVLLAESGLLDGREATTHWAIQTLFASHYPSVKLRMEQVLVTDGPDHQIITAGGASSWEDLALYLINRFLGRAETIRTAKIFLLGDRSDGQLPYAAISKPKPHSDAAISECQTWIADHYPNPKPVAHMAERANMTERTFKRRFRAATGYTPVTYVQTLRVEEAKQLLETTAAPSDEIAASVGYEDPAFFRRLFKRQTGLTPGRYRQRFQSLGRSPTERSQDNPNV
ncbi:GlxA family transcriptional regulator [Pelagibius sp. Alg239-R121]|uniref:GlxA family transcriptional regulator n=1 Tax=Pelagibius sp. Alg239-R121 TaxID=2993448 RepID=UPI0024A6F0D7|nr:helix-turn-helix domain-containing protein [Pelagibius sp. Alg239-R121]